MSAFENAKKFFEACEAPKGWEACKPYVAEGARFESQCEPLTEIDTVKAYAEWMTGFIRDIAPESNYDLHATSYDEASRTAMFFGTYHLKHTKDGGPVPPTGKVAHANYVYCLKMNADDRVEKMIKIWNAPWTLAELGWA
jgi:hypothetical protein